jgi:hypothetical protein
MGMLLFLQSWWSRIYNRPLKDPILQTYTLEELLYEYFNHIEREEYAKEIQEEAEETKDQTKYDDAAKWAEEEEKREQEQEQEKQTVKEAQEGNLTQDDVRWMEEQLAKEKEVRGDSFGENISEEFE